MSFPLPHDALDSTLLSPPLTPPVPIAMSDTTHLWSGGDPNPQPLQEEVQVRPTSTGQNINDEPSDADVLGPLETEGQSAMAGSLGGVSQHTAHSIESSSQNTVDDATVVGQIEDLIRGTTNLTPLLEDTNNPSTDIEHSRQMKATENDASHSDPSSESGSATNIKIEVSGSDASMSQVEACTINAQTPPEMEGSALSNVMVSTSDMLVLPSLAAIFRKNFGSDNKGLDHDEDLPANEISKKAPQDVDDSAAQKEEETSGSDSSGSFVLISSVKPEVNKSDKLISKPLVPSKPDINGAQAKNDSAMVEPEPSFPTSEETIMGMTYVEDPETFQEPVVPEEVFLPEHTGALRSEETDSETTYPEETDSEAVNNSETEATTVQHGELSPSPSLTLSVSSHVDNEYGTLVVHSSTTQHRLGPFPLEVAQRVNLNTTVTIRTYADASNLYYALIDETTHSESFPEEKAENLSIMQAPKPGEEHTPDRPNWALAPPEADLAAYMYPNRLGSRDDRSSYCSGIYPDQYGQAALPLPEDYCQIGDNPPAPPQSFGENAETIPGWKEFIPSHRSGRLTEPIALQPVAPQTFVPEHYTHESWAPEPPALKRQPPAGDPYPSRTLYTFKSLPNKRNEEPTMGTEVSGSASTTTTTLSTNASWDDRPASNQPPIDIYNTKHLVNVYTHKPPARERDFSGRDTPPHLKPGYRRPNTRFIGQGAEDLSGFRDIDTPTPAISTRSREFEDPQHVGIPQNALDTGFQCGPTGGGGYESGLDERNVFGGSRRPSYADVVCDKRYGEREDDRGEFTGGRDDRGGFTSSRGDRGGGFGGGRDDTGGFGGGRDDRGGGFGGRRCNRGAGVALGDMGTGFDGVRDERGGFDREWDGGYRGGRRSRAPGGFEAKGYRGGRTSGRLGGSGNKYGGGRGMGGGDFSRGRNRGYGGIQEKFDDRNNCGRGRNDEAMAPADDGCRTDRYGRLRGFSNGRETNSYGGDRDEGYRGRNKDDGGHEVIGRGHPGRYGAEARNRSGEFRGNGFKQAIHQASERGGQGFGDRDDTEYEGKSRKLSDTTLRALSRPSWTEETGSAKRKANVATFDDPTVPTASRDGWCNPGPSTSPQENVIWEWS